MDEHATFISVGTLTPAPGKAEELIGVCRGWADRMGELDGCFGAQVVRQDGRPDTISVIARWRDRAARDAATKTNEAAQAAEAARSLATVGVEQSGFSVV